MVEFVNFAERQRAEENSSFGILLIVFFQTPCEITGFFRDFQDIAGFPRE